MDLLEIIELQKFLMDEVEKSLDPETNMLAEGELTKLVAKVMEKYPKATMEQLWRLLLSLVAVHQGTIIMQVKANNNLMARLARARIIGLVDEMKNKKKE